ncbi:hypothetical protein SUNI508_02885 [Seiridium unicorne]|uniref:Uncharacterized protein n=1 Tax=Seiridium unicorne TaxID=138068 RepID=A0ABR2VHW0_9PEZI
MPAATEAPSVALSFANNFWGKEDAGVGPLLDRMLYAKQTCDELRSFYSARASIEDDYSRKLMALCRKSLGSHELGTLKLSLDTVRGEVEAMAKQHSGIAAQMKTELEEPLAAFAGGMKERRKIVQNTVEKLLKIKVQQTQTVNKTRDRYEQDCLKIKGYLAQGHMVMGQEERKNKARLEKTQISLATSNAEYENAVKALEDTTARWNREWKAAADKFQDLEEERLDFTKSSLWTFANIASTVCVSDDASCEKIRLSLENLEVEKDIINFITERGTGQEIPDPPKYINFCRGDVEDHESIASVDDDNYSVAQFPRSINPAYRTSSPQPSTFESHHDPNSALARDLSHHDEEASRSREATMTPQKGPGSVIPPDGSRQGHPMQQQRQQQQQQQPYDATDFAAVPHDPYPMDGMTMLCRTDTGMGPGTGSGMNSATSSNLSSNRPSSRDDNSEYSNPTSFSSQEPASGKVSPIKQQQPQTPMEAQPEKRVLKKKSGFFQNHSPFRRKSTRDIQASNRNTWGPSSQDVSNTGSASRRPTYQPEQSMLPDRATASPEPIDANASLALNVGNNVFAVSNTDRRNKPSDQPQQEELDPIAQALAELREVAGNKQSTVRVSADHYHGIATPVPPQGDSRPFSRSVPAPRSGSDVAAGLRGTPPPSYDQQVQRLGVPAPACTSKAMQATSRKYEQQTRNMFNPNRPGSGGTHARTQSRPPTRGTDMPRAASPAPPRSASPRPGTSAEQRHSQAELRQSHGRSASPNPYSGSQHQRSQSSVGMAPPSQRGSAQGYYRHNSPNDMARSASPAPSRLNFDRPSSSHMGGDMAVQLAPVGDEGGYGSQRGRNTRPGTSQGGQVAFYDGRQMSTSRQRSKSLADPSRMYTRDGRPILHLARALYVYQAAIAEELGFSKGDTLAVLRHQDDGWWEAEIHAGNGVGRSGLSLLSIQTRERLTSSTVRRAGCPTMDLDAEDCSPWLSDSYYGHDVAVCQPRGTNEQRPTGMPSRAPSPTALAVRNRPAFLLSTSIFRAATPASSPSRKSEASHADAPDGAPPGKMEYVKRPIRAATTPGAQRLYLSTFLFVTTSLLLLLVAATVYPIFYYTYVPKKVVSIPVHLQYNAGLNPFGVTSLQKDLMLETAYDVTVSLTMPRCPPNTDRGNFMVALFATRSSLENPAQSFTIPQDPYRHINPSNVVFSSRRPALVPYTDPLVSLASRLLFLLWHLFAPTSERVELQIPMGELVEFREQLPLSLLLDVQAGQTFQVYTAQIELVARLSGIRWMMYNHRFISFVVGTTFFWFAEMLWMGLTWLALAYCFGWRKPGKEVPAIKQDGDASEYDHKTVVKRESEDERYSTARSSKGARVRDRSLKDEDEDEDDQKFIKRESVERELPKRQLGYGEDDEAEGTGSSYGKGKHVVRRRSSGEPSGSSTG